MSCNDDQGQGQPSPMPNQDRIDNVGRWIDSLPTNNQIGDLAILNASLTNDSTLSGSAGVTPSPCGGVSTPGSAAASDPNSSRMRTLTLQLLMPETTNVCHRCGQKETDSCKAQTCTKQTQSPCARQQQSPCARQQQSPCSRRQQSPCARQQQTPCARQQQSQQIMQTPSSARSGRGGGGGLYEVTPPMLNDTMSSIGGDQMDAHYNPTIIGGGQVANMDDLAGDGNYGIVPMQTLESTAIGDVDLGLNQMEAPAYASSGESSFNIPVVNSPLGNDQFLINQTTWSGGIGSVGMPSFNSSGSSPCARPPQPQQSPCARQQQSVRYPVSPASPCPFTGSPCTTNQNVTNASPNFVPPVVGTPIGGNLNFSGMSGGLGSVGMPSFDSSGSSWAPPQAGTTCGENFNFNESSLSGGGLGSIGAPSFNSSVPSSPCSRPPTPCSRQGTPCSRPQTPSSPRPCPYANGGLQGMSPPLMTFSPSGSSGCGPQAPPPQAGSPCSRAPTPCSRQQTPCGNQPVCGSCGSPVDPNTSGDGSYVPPVVGSPLGNDQFLINQTTWSGGIGSVGPPSFNSSMSSGPPQPSPCPSPPSPFPISITNTPEQPFVPPQVGTPLGGNLDFSGMSGGIGSVGAPSFNTSSSGSWAPPAVSTPCGQNLNFSGMSGGGLGSVGAPSFNSSGSSGPCSRPPTPCPRQATPCQRLQTPSPQQARPQTPCQRAQTPCSRPQTPCSRPQTPCGNQPVCGSCGSPVDPNTSSDGSYVPPVVGSPLGNDQFLINQTTWSGGIGSVGPPSFNSSMSSGPPQPSPCPSPPSPFPISITNTPEQPFVPPQVGTPLGGNLDFSGMSGGGGLGSVGAPSFNTSSSGSWAPPAVSTPCGQNLNFSGMSGGGLGSVGAPSFNSSGSSGPCSRPQTPCQRQAAPSPCSRPQTPCQRAQTPCSRLQTPSPAPPSPFQYESPDVSGGPTSFNTSGSSGWAPPVVGSPLGNDQFLINQTTWSGGIGSVGAPSLNSSGSSGTCPQPPSPFPIGITNTPEPPFVPPQVGSPLGGNLDFSGMSGGGGLGSIGAPSFNTSSSGSWAPPAVSTPCGQNLNFSGMSGGGGLGSVGAPSFNTTSSSGGTCPPPSPCGGGSGSAPCDGRPIPSANSIMFCVDNISRILRNKCPCLPTDPNYATCKRRTLCALVAAIHRTLGTLHQGQGGQSPVLPGSGGCRGPNTGGGPGGSPPPPPPAAPCAATIQLPSEPAPCPFKSNAVPEACSEAAGSAYAKTRLGPLISNDIKPLDLDCALAAIPIPPPCPVSCIEPDMGPRKCGINQSRYTSEREREPKFFPPQAGHMSDGIGGPKCRSFPQPNLGKPTLDGAGGRKPRGMDD